HFLFFLFSYLMFFLVVSLMTFGYSLISEYLILSHCTTSEVLICRFVYISFVRLLFYTYFSPLHLYR
ncbi:hypothetical protein L9F63_018216, partial [Diploptera punctata]